ncbi:MAG: hypothetical protein NC489_12900 [Ruminococcus flavefaciens]|nr:hypothetical protein [Ruminococcus flavefaciens]
MKNTKKNIIWNAIAGIINACEAVLILAIVSRINSLTESGIITIAFSLGNLFMTIGKFGMRDYQVAHEKYDFPFKTFFAARIFTSILMIFIIILYLSFCWVSGQYTEQKILVIFFVSLWYAVEAFEDVFIAKYQVMGRLDIGSKFFVLRWIITIITFIGIDFITRNIIYASFGAFLGGLLIMIFLVVHSYQDRNNSLTLCKNLGLMTLFKECLPLCISAFINYYIINIPKYAINSLLNDELQAIYGYLAMPVFVIGLLNNFIYMPQLTNYVTDWKTGNTKQLFYRIMRQYKIIIYIMLFCLAGAYIVGTPLLSALYHYNLSTYKLYLLILLVGSGFLAVGTYISHVLTIIDKQQAALGGYIFVSIISSALIWTLVKYFRLLGAVVGCTISMALFAMTFSAIMYKCYKNTPDSP